MSDGLPGVTLKDPHINAGSEDRALVEHRSADVAMADIRPSGDGVVTGWGTISGRAAFVFAKDFTVLGGSLSEAHAEKIAKIQAMALEARAPIIGLFDSLGARLQDGVAALAGIGSLLRGHAEASGVIPQISVIMGPCEGADAVAPPLTDFVVMVRDSSHLALSAPAAVKAVTGRSVSVQELGGACVHTSVSAVADMAFDSDVDALLQVRRLLDFLPSHNLDVALSWPSLDHAEREEPSLETLVPRDADAAYDIIELIGKVIDEGDFFELQEAFARNMVIGFGRIDGRRVGIVANQPLVLSGVIDADAARKAARFVRFCDAFGIPVVTFVDAAGFLPEVGQEHAGLARQVAKLSYAYSEATVPMVSVVIRKAFGGAYDVMGSKHLGCDVNYAWPTAQIAMMEARGAAGMLSRDAADDPSVAEARAKDYAARVLSPAAAAKRGYIDAVIAPRSTRSRISRSLALLRGKMPTRAWRKHDNLPL